MGWNLLLINFEVKYCITKGVHSGLGQDFYWKLIFGGLKNLSNFTTIKTFYKLNLYEFKTTFNALLLDMINVSVKCRASYEALKRGTPYFVKFVIGDGIHCLTKFQIWDEGPIFKSFESGFKCMNNI